MTYRKAHKDVPSRTWYDSILTQTERQQVAEIMKQFQQSEDYEAGSDNLIDTATEYLVKEMQLKNPKYAHFPPELRGIWVKRWVSLEKEVVKLLNIP